MNATQKSELIMLRLISEARSLGALESRERFLADSVKQIEATSNRLANEADRLGKLNRPGRDVAERTVYRGHLRILREEARDNALFRRSCMEEARTIKREMVEAQSTIRALTEKLLSRLH